MKATVNVSYGREPYVARCNGKTVSTTHSALAAIQRAAMKAARFMPNTSVTRGMRADGVKGYEFEETGITLVKVTELTYLAEWEEKAQ